jgi:hypothetical protein
MQEESDCVLSRGALSRRAAGPPPQADLSAADGAGQRRAWPVEIDDHGSARIVENNLCKPSPSWFFAAHPGSNIIALSHIASLAETNSSYVQRFIQENSETRLQCS